MTSPTQEHQGPSPIITNNDQQESIVTNTNDDEEATYRYLTNDDNKQEALPSDISIKKETLHVDTGAYKQESSIPSDDNNKENQEINLSDVKEQETLPTNSSVKQETTASIPIEGNDQQQQPATTTFTDTEWWEETILNNIGDKQEANNPNDSDKVNPVDVHQDKEPNPNNVVKCDNVHDNKQKGEDGGEKDQEEVALHREEAVVFSDNQGVVSVPTTDDQTEETISNQQEATSSRRFEPAPSTQYHIVQFEENYITVTVTNNNEAVDQWIDSIKRTHNDTLQELLIGLYIELVPTEETEAPWRDLATLQLCVGKECLVFQLQQAGKTMSIKLRHFLYTGGYTFVSPGIDVQDKMLQAFNLYVAKRVDLRELAAYRRQDLVIYQRDGVEELARAILRKEYKRLPEVKFYPWQVVLSEEQVKYACLDAYLCYEIGKALDAYGFRVQTRFYLSHIFTSMATRPSSFGGSSR